MPSSVATTPTIAASSSPKASTSLDPHDFTMSHVSSESSVLLPEGFVTENSTPPVTDHTRSRKQVLQLRRSPPPDLNDDSPPLIKKIRREVRRPYVRYCDVIKSDAASEDHGIEDELHDNDVTKEMVTPPVKMVIKTNAGQSQAILLEDSYHLPPLPTHHLTEQPSVKTKISKTKPKVTENGKSKKTKGKNPKINKMNLKKENGDIKKTKVKVESKSKSKAIKKTEELSTKPKAEKSVRSKPKSTVKLKDKKKSEEARLEEKSKSPGKGESSKKVKDKKTIMKGSEASSEVSQKTTVEDKVVKPKRKRVRKKKVPPPVDLPEMPKQNKSSKNENLLQYNLLYPRRVVGPVVHVQSAIDKKKKKTKQKESIELEANDKRLDIPFEFSVLNFCDEQSRDQNSSSYSARLKRAKERMVTTPAPGQSQISWLCLFCHLPQNAHHLGFLYGPYFLEDAPTDELADLPTTSGKCHSKSAQPPREIWFHEDCYIWSNPLLVCPPITPLHRAQLNYLAKTHCAGCQKNGAGITCSVPGCLTGSWHYPCALRAGFLFYEPTFCVYCITHLDHYKRHFQFPYTPIASLPQ